MTQDEIKELAKQAGGMPYVNQHLPGKLAVAFSGQALIDFVALVQQAGKTPPNCGTGHCSCIECMAKCQWTPEDDATDTYASACGELWSFIDGGPLENNIKSCHLCGQQVEVNEQP
jgi:hypothetical protein